MFLAHVSSLQASIFSLLAIVSLLLAFVMLGSHWLRNYVYAFAAESWLIAALSAAVGYFGGYPELYVIAALTALFRGLVLPYLLMGIVKKLNVKREIHAVLEPSSSLVVGALLVMFAFVIANHMNHQPPQEEDWRRLLSFSSAENASVAITVLGVSALFFLASFASLAWTVALLHLAAHSLAKGTLFLTSDGVYQINGDYGIRQTGLLRRSPILYGIGAAFAAMSLAALPPQAGFATEWYIFQSLFQGTQANDLVARLTIALAAAGLALVAAVALATFVKLFGIGLLGDGHDGPTHLRHSRSASVFVLGMCVLGLAVGMPWWLRSLEQTNLSIFGVDAAALMLDGWLLVPLSSHFAFISPTKLIIAGPLLALVPLELFWFSRQAHQSRRVPVWSGGRREDARQIATTSLAFSNALRTFYSFIYGPTHNVEREYQQSPYFVKRLIFNQEVAPIFGPYLFARLTRFVRALSVKVGGLQSGYLNAYNAMIGILLVLILALTLFYK